MSEEKTELLDCPCCGKTAAEREMNYQIFAGQVYSDRYPGQVASQHHGFRVRCAACGVQTCWWHYQDEADNAWNNRPTLAAAPTPLAPEPSAIVGMDSVADLLSLINDLECGKETHRHWRDCDQSCRDANPAIGDSAFHDCLVSVYNNRIAIVKSAAEQLATLQAKIEAANCALGEHPDAAIDIAQRISELRDEGRGHFHTVTKLQANLSVYDKWLSNGVYFTDAEYKKEVADTTSLRSDLEQEAQNCSKITNDKADLLRALRNILIMASESYSNTKALAEIVSIAKKAAAKYEVTSS